MSAGNARVHLFRFGRRAFRGAGAVERKVARFSAQFDKQFADRARPERVIRESSARLDHGT